MLTAPVRARIAASPSEWATEFGHQLSLARPDWPTA